MPADYWDSGVRKFGHVEEDEEEWIPRARSEVSVRLESDLEAEHEDLSVRRFGPGDSDDELETVERVIRHDGRNLSPQEVEEVLAQEQAEREDREEQEQLRQLVRAGEVVFVDVNEFRREKRRLEQLNHELGSKRGEDA
ncbi:hypothetical protein [Segniliparus rugosus]|uniref:Uncharacterized protein n=1 Tax=Segniliparus rugosus (strain ATCC BAA-974 / DSM 45345 / CCUG 50838 / CIP 108380 / JCM 13579 / CDC 945) TaxID=679197 RepID=E5XQH9_SEGRC|nr:hypothetical protein [Segniliparus rugosus]EFV13397.1 hypothetical protein HMPREF9336_01751 [Segniliparus rugosus ATCC BAA-974]